MLFFKHTCWAIRFVMKATIHNYNGNNYLYFIVCNNEFVKIGITNNLDNRIKEMQTGNPYKLKIGAYIPNISKTLERKIHKMFSQYRQNGEWFDIKVFDIIRTKYHKLIIMPNCDTLENWANEYKRWKFSND